MLGTHRPHDYVGPRFGCLRGHSTTLPQSTDVHPPLSRAGCGGVHTHARCACAHAFQERRLADRKPRVLAAAKVPCCRKRHFAPPTLLCIAARTEPNRLHSLDVGTAGSIHCYYDPRFVLVLICSPTPPQGMCTWCLWWVGFLSRRLARCCALGPMSPSGAT